MEFEVCDKPAKEKSWYDNLIAAAVANSGKAVRIMPPAGMKRESFRARVLVAARYRNVKISTNFHDGYLYIWKREK